MTDIFHIAALYRLFSTPVASLKASMSPSSSSAWAWTPFQVFFLIIPQVVQFVHRPALLLHPGVVLEVVDPLAAW